MTENSKLSANNSTGQSKSTVPFGSGRPGHVGMGLVEKPKNFFVTMKKLISYLQPFWVAIIFVFVFAVVSTVFAIVSPKILGNMTNQVISDSPQINFSKLEFFVIELLLLYIFSTIFSYLQGWIMTVVSQKIAYQFRRDISEKINRLPLAYFDKKTFGEVLSRVTNDVDTVSQTLNQSLTQIVTSITLIIGILIMMFVISWPMTLVSLFLVPFSLALMALIIKKSQDYFKEQQNSLGEINGHVEEMYAGHNVMRVFNGEKQSVQKFQKINAPSIIGTTKGTPCLN